MIDTANESVYVYYTNGSSSSPMCVCVSIDVLLLIFIIDELIMLTFFYMCY